MNEAHQPARIVFVAAVAPLLIALACHPSHYQAVRVATCDGDNALVVQNHSNGAVDVYFTAPKWKKSEFLGLADVGETELPMPPMYTMQGYRFEARRHTANGGIGGLSVGPDAVQFHVACHPR